MTQMKAIVFTKYGSPEVLQLKEVEKPVPKENEILLRVHAVSINPYEWHKMRAEPFLVRLSDGLFSPKHTILGSDVAGRVEAVGKNITQFKVGDEVFGTSHHGGLAEYVSVAEDKLVLKPANATFEEAATLSIAAITALQGIRDNGQVKAGQKVLINGASGGVGTFAVQIAKSFDAQVTGVCSTRNIEMVRSIGADHVIDYTKKSLTETNTEKYDRIFDAVGNLSVSDYEGLLSPKGICVVAGFTSMALIFQVMLKGRLSKNKIGLLTIKINQKDLGIMHDLVESGKVKPVIDRTYPLEQTAEAIGYLEKGHARGKVVITLAYTNKLEKLL